MSSILENPLIQKLLSLNLPTKDYVIFGSAPMFAHGIRELGTDIDLLARDGAWKKALTLGQPVQAPMGSNSVIRCFQDEIEIFDGWAPGEWDSNSLIDNADVIEGVRFVNLETVIRWKKIMGREKDMEHIKQIEKYLSKKIT